MRKNKLLNDTTNSNLDQKNFHEELAVIQLIKTFAYLY